MRKLFNRRKTIFILTALFVFSGCAKRIPQFKPPVVKLTQAEKAALEKERLAREQGQHHYNLGIIWKKSDPAEAIKEFEQAVEVYPKLAEAFYELGEIYAAQKNKELAARNYQRAFEVDNKNYKALLKIARMYRDARDYQMALQVCEQVLALEPRNEEAMALGQEIVEYQQMPKRLFDDAWKYLGNERYQAALETFEKIFKYDSEYVDAYWGIGETYRRLGDYAKAEKYFHQAIKLKPDYSRAHSGLGWLEMERDDEEKAARHFREALVKDGDNVDAFEGLKQALAAMTEKVPQRYYDRGIGLLEKGDLGEAMGQFERSLSFNQKFYRSIYALGDVLLKQGKPLLAEEKYLAALALAPQDIDILLRLARLYDIMGHYEESIARYDELLDINPDLTEVLSGKAGVEKKVDRALGSYRLGQKLMKYGSTVEARDEYAKALEVNPQFKLAWVGMADALFEEKDYASAKIHYLKALDFDPMFQPALVGLARTEYYLDDLSKASYYLEQAEKVYPGSEQAAMVSRLLEKGSLTRAPKEYEKLAAKEQISRGDWAALLALDLEAGQLIAPQREMPVITDIEENWAREYVVEVVLRNLMGVYNNHTFAPEKLVIRQELAYYIQNLLIALDQTRFSADKFAESHSPLKDVSEKHVFFNAIMLATSSGIMDVNETGEFNPEAGVSGSEARAVIAQVKQMLLNNTVSQAGLN